MLRRFFALLIAMGGTPLAAAQDSGDWLQRLREGGGSFLSLAVSVDRVAIGGSAGVVLLDPGSGRTLMRWLEPVDRVWIDEAGVLWALPTEGERNGLLRWRPDQTAPEDLTLEEASKAGVPLWRRQEPVSDAPALPAALRDSLGPVQDGGGAVWRVDSSEGAVWRGDHSGWREVGAAPPRVGIPLELRGDPRDGVLWLLGSTGVARIDRDGNSHVLFSQTVRDLMPAWLLTLLALTPALAIAFPVGGALAFGCWWRGVRVWSLLDAALAVGLFLTAQLAVGVSLWALGLELGTAMIVGSFSGGAMVSLAFLAWRLKVQGLTWPEIGLRRAPWIGEAVWGVGAALAAWSVLPLLTWICQALSLPRFLYEQTLGQVLDPHGLPETIVLVFTIAVLAPVTEEILFRGYALRALSIRLGRWPAVLITTTTFGLAHGQGALLTGALGLIFAWVALRRESIWPSILAHALINGVSLTLLLAGFAS